MRPINSMIEFKQIIGRGTRLYDGKDYFTIYDFVKAHHHFNDPDWNGDPLEPEPCEQCGLYPCQCPAQEPSEPRICAVCRNRPCTCPHEICAVCAQEPCTCRRRARVKLAGGKERMIEAMMSTTFWHPDGTPITAQPFMQLLFGKLPEFFKNEEELRKIWSVPDTRKLLLHGLAENGFGRDQLKEMQKIIDAEKCDLFDVLAYVAYALPPQTRGERATRARATINAQFTSRQQAFLDFVLAHYVKDGEEELDQQKLPPLLNLKYGAIQDALEGLGSPEDINQAFIGFQRYLYEQGGDSFIAAI